MPKTTLRERARVAGDISHNRSRRKGTALLRALWTTFRTRTIVSAVICVGDSAVHISQALALGWLIAYFDDENSSSLSGWLAALSIVVIGFVYSVFDHHLFFLTWVLGMLLRISTTTILYDKILRLRLSSLGQITTGHLINLATTDVERLQTGCIFLHYLWEAPLETVVILWLGLWQVGVSFLSAFVALALLMPMQAVFSRKFASVRRRMTALTDERVKLTNQAVTGARLMKINAWEPALEKEICRVRAEEIGVLMKATILRAINEALFFIQPAILSFLVFGTYYLLGNTLTPEKVFTTLALLNVTQFSMGKFFYLAVQNLSESWVSLQRLEAMLLMEENEILMEPLREFDVAIKRAGVSSTAIARQGSFSAHAMTIAPKPKPAATGQKPVDATKREASTRSSSKGNGGEEEKYEQVANGVYDKAGGGGGGSAEDSVKRNPGLVSLVGVNFRWSSAGEENEHAKAFRELAEKGKGKKGKGAVTVGGNSGQASGEDNGNGHGDTDAGFTLQSINLTIKPGQLVGIVGSVGSSKSSLLMTVLREIAPHGLAGSRHEATIPAGTMAEAMDRDETSVKVEGRLAYAPQEPWIQSGTVRENILFGKRMDRERYDAVVRDCSLARDLSILPSGDLTGIGDRGVNLSGGQKARVGLARMAYAQADTYLMDDPMSAVDPAVGRELFSNVVCGRLTGKTRILVTHQVHYLRDPAVNEIVVMDYGKIVARGRYEELDANGWFAALNRPPSSSKESAAARVQGEEGDDEDAALSGVKLDGIVEERPSRLELHGADDDAEEEKETQEYRRSRAGGLVDDGEDSASTFEGSFSAHRQGRGWDMDSAVTEGSMLMVGALSIGRQSSTHSFFGSEVGRSTVESVAEQQQQQQLEDDQKKGVPAELVVAEDKESGGLKRGVYWEYAREAAGIGQVAVIFAAMAGGQVLIMVVTVWLATWSGKSPEEQKRSYYIEVMAALVAAAIVVSLLRSVLAFSSLVKASHRLHDRMLKRVIRAPILFFDSNPVGRILNRFTKDMHFMDDMLTMTLYDFVMCTFMVLGSTIIVFYVNAWVILSMLPAVAYFVYLLGFYIKTSREVKRLEATTRSPVFSQLSETLDGLVTIRAFGNQHRFLKQFTKRVDLNTRAYFAWIYTARWLGFRMDVIVVMVLIASCFFSVAINEYSSSIDVGLLGAALVYVIQLGGLFQWTVRQAAETENQMVSAERVLAYCKVPQEANLDSEPENKPPDDWPSKGDIEIRELFLRYREDLPAVLKGLDVTIVGGSRVGIVGRTGAGKSSLVSAMFRLVEYDKDRGGMTIDGVDISKVGLHDLRPRMSVVPQTPFLFSGSMRLNLDPFARQSDVDMWAALEAVQMKEYVQSLPGGLDAPVTEGGGNLSVGQRQLLCLARAVLQRSKILVMDEATANIDQHTDSLIQDVVRTSFEGRTVIMIAHRLNTVIDCDQIVVLSEGRVVEAGHPHVLLTSSATEKASMAEGSSGVIPTPSNATLASMVEETGPANAMHLRRLARKAWEAKTH